MLIVHSSREEEQELADLLGKISDYQGIPAGLCCTQDSDQWLATVKERAIETRAHLVLVDRSCVSEKQRWERLQQELAPVQCVMCVGATIGAQRAMHAFLDRLWLAPPLRRKRYLASPLGAAVDRAFKGLRAPFQSQSIVGKPHLEAAARRIGVTLDEIEELLAYLFPDAAELHIGALYTQGPSRSIARGRSALLTVSVDRRVDQVLKLAPREKVMREATNYSKFVEGRLIGTRHAVLARSTVLWNVGGLVYSLIGSGERVPPPFSSFFQAQNPQSDRIARAVREVFGAWSRHYSGHYLADRPQATEQPLFVQYNEVWGNKLGGRLEALRSALLPLPTKFGFLPHPVPWLSENAEKSATVLMRKAVTHGDLHGDNILVDDDGHCWLLDFERTGAGPILQDFAELENDILTRLTDIPLEEFFALCVGLVEPARPDASIVSAIRKYVPGNRPFSPKALAAVETLIELRPLAKEHTRYEDSRELLWGLLLNAIYALSLSLEQGGEDEQEQVRRNRLLILSAVICQRLSRWTDYARAPNWPPREWEGILSPGGQVRQPPEHSSHAVGERLELRVTVEDRRLTPILHGSGYSFRTCDDIMLQREPREILGRIFDTLSFLVRRSPNLGSNDQETLDTIGYNLYDELFRSDLKREYESFRNSRLGLVIVSDDPWIPWEVVKPYGSNWTDPHLCEKFFLTRWLSGGAAPIHMSPNKAVIVRPPDNLRAAEQELEYFASLPMASNGLVQSVVHLEAKSDVLNSFRAGDVNLYHFACHGNFDQSDPNEPRLRLRDGSLAPSDITGMVKFGLERAKPIVFLNACHSGRIEFGLTRLGGWATRFIEAGASTFIGTLWEVNDQLAAIFAIEFYNRLLGINNLEQQALAQAVHGARMVIKERAPTNPTWLAYVVYGDPNARVVRPT
ncbi:MAG: CHAT domain-containing protein [Gemmatales bacterium]|nr:CHAT domain-containing protein [Gemmatales bacterium]